MKILPPNFCCSGRARSLLIEIGAFSAAPG